MLLFRNLIKWKTTIVYRGHIGIMENTVGTIKSKLPEDGYVVNNKASILWVTQFKFLNSNPVETQSPSVPHDPRIEAAGVQDIQLGEEFCRPLNSHRLGTAPSEITSKLGISGIKGISKLILYIYSSTVTEGGQNLTHPPEPYSNLLTA